MNPDIDKEYIALCEGYTKNLPVKINDIQKAFKELSLNWGMKNLVNFSSLIHKLNGSAGIYGYKSISDKAAIIEKYISQFDHDIPADPASIELIKSYINEIETMITSQKKDEKKIVLTTVKTNLVYLLTFEKHYSTGKEWADKLTKQAETYGYNITTFYNIESLLSALQDNVPIALIINFDLLSNPFEVNLKDSNIQEMIRLYLKKFYAIFVSSSGDVEKRLSAVRMGCKSYIVEPFNIDVLISQLENLRYLWVGHFKALIVDDDPDILKYHSDLLTKANIENKGLSSYKEIENELHKFQPDIILLDLNMPLCTGIELASIIRQQKAYEDIPIIYLSTEENKRLQLEAISVGADDFIMKSVEPDILIQSVRNKASRYKKIKMMFTKDNITGAFNYRYMAREIDRYIQIYKQTAKKFTLGVCQINNLSSIKSTYGYTASDQLLIGLYLLLNNTLDPSKIIGHLSPEQFLIIFPDSSSDTAGEEMKKIQEKFQSTLQYADKKTYSSTFSFGLVTYKECWSIDEFIKMVSDQLKNALTK